MHKSPLLTSYNANLVLSKGSRRQGRMEYKHHCTTQTQRLHTTQAVTWFTVHYSSSHYHSQSVQRMNPNTFSKYFLLSSTQSISYNRLPHSNATNLTALRLIYHFLWLYLVSYVGIFNNDCCTLVQ